MIGVKRIEIKGRLYTYRDVGQGVPTLWLHAFPLWGASFMPQMESLADMCRLIVPDHRGFGGSAMGPGPSTMHLLADDALTLLDTLGIARAVVAGVSMGGYTAMELTRIDPSRVSGLLLIDTQMSADDEAGRQKREETAKAIEAKGPSHLVETLVPKLLSAKAPAALRTRVTEWIQSAQVESLTAAVRGMALRADSRDILARFHGPSCVVVGAEDTITPPEKAKAMAELLEGSEIHIVPNAAHLTQLEAPEAFNAIARNFLKRTAN